MPLEPGPIVQTTDRIRKRWRWAMFFALTQGFFGSWIFAVGADRARYSNFAVAVIILVNLVVCSLYAKQWTRHTRRAIQRIEAEKSRIYRLQSITHNGP